MSTISRHDAWQAGDSYELYMGRWSRPIAARFLDWLAMSSGLDWLDLGCGTGALTEAILRQCDPASVIAIDPSEGFLARAQANVPDPRAQFHVGDAASLGAIPADSRDVAVSALAINFIPAPVGALAEMKRIVRPGGTVGFYVWDYPGGGIELMRAFWAAAVALDPAASELGEDRRFPFCTQEGLLDMAREAGWVSAECTSIEIPSVFRDFEDYWQPFTLGAGPAPGYCASLAPDARQRLRDRLSATLERSEDGSITLMTRAWAIKARVR
ncbi:class I SAM-dependent methyltransferase [Faunimonas sp. B44]|uniref:class I SAM-dependent methyltransferase n=1 Tax=Faunimonas sp. B44 TaxID=3461493 RepID=UPI004044AD63